MNKTIFQKYKIIFLLILSLFSTKLFSLELYDETWEKLPVEGKQKTVYVNSTYTKILTIFKDYNESSEYFFYKEIQILNKLNKHPNIIKLIDYDPKLYSITLEYCDIDLIDFINKNPYVTEKEILNIFIDIARGINHMHDNDLIHKDIKPENVVLKFKENLISAKLIDFSFCEKIQKKTNYAIAKYGLGTPGYVCPYAYYQIENQLENIFIYKSADIYSFGALMYSVLNEKTLINLYFENLKQHYMSKVENYNKKQIEKSFKLFLIEKIKNKKNWFPPFSKNIKLSELKKLIYQCLNLDHTKRPNINTVLRKLLKIKSKISGKFEELENDDNWEPMFI
jgi:serine/threonine protein kinase